MNDDALPDAGMQDCKGKELFKQVFLFFFFFFFFWFDGLCKEIPKPYPVYREHTRQ